MQNYKVKVFDIAFLDDVIIEKFTSDFRLVAKFFKNKRLGRVDSFGNDKIIHVQELIDFFFVFTKSSTSTKIYHCISISFLKGVIHAHKAYIKVLWSAMFKT